MHVAQNTHAAHSPPSPVIYLVAGVPGNFLLWYRPLYKGAQNDKAFGFAAFFISTLALLVFMIWSAVGMCVYDEEQRYTTR